MLVARGVIATPRTRVPGPAPVAAADDARRLLETLAAELGAPA
jgi:hypothetical protein